MHVSPATADDLPALCDLLGMLFAQEAEFLPDPERQAAGLRAILDRPEVGKVLVLRDGPQAVGMVSLLFLPSTALGGRVAMLEDMVVRPDTRGGGAGSRLLQTAVEFARAAGCLRLTLLTDVDNAAAQRFYTRHGFGRSAMIPMRLMLGSQNIERAGAADAGGM
jgi:ribosomal protein S18 acetylase RimI-like enzyme